MGSEQHGCLNTTQMQTMDMLTLKGGGISFWETSSFSSWHQRDSFFLTQHDMGENIWQGYCKGAEHQIPNEGLSMKYGNSENYSSKMHHWPVLAFLLLVKPQELE